MGSHGQHPEVRLGQHTSYINQLDISPVLDV
jgi:hypothetical protein